MIYYHYIKIKVRLPDFYDKYKSIIASTTATQIKITISA